MFQKSAEENILSESSQEGDTLSDGKGSSKQRD